MAKARRRKSGDALPVGEAIVRLISVQYNILDDLDDGVAPPPRMLRERDQLQEALNAYTVTMGFECRLDGSDTLIEDAVEAAESTALEMIRSSAATSCCRITKADSLPKTPDSGRPRVRKTSRSKK
jgi:hypothetical protein